MRGRTRSWDEGLAKDLRRKEFAQEFIQALIRDGDSLQEALAGTIRAYGVNDFAELIGMSSPSLQRAINPAHNASKRTLEQLMKPFGLRLGVERLKPARRVEAGGRKRSAVA